MYKYAIALIFVVFFVCPNVSAEEWTGNVNVLLGQKSLEEDDWKPLEKQLEFAVEGDFKEKSWPVSITIGIVGTADKETITLYSYDIEMEGTTSEINLGIKKIFDNSGIIRPFIGGGLSLISAEIKATAEGVSVSTDDTGTGFWLSGGVYWTFDNHFNLGAEVKYSRAEGTFGDVDADMGGTHLGALIGYHW